MSSTKKRRRTFNPIRFLIQSLIVVFAVIAILRSDEAIEVVSSMPFISERFFQFFGLVLDPTYHSQNVNILFEVYKHVVIALMGGTISWLLTATPIGLLLDILWPNDDPDTDPEDWSHYEKGVNTKIKYFVVGLFATAIASWLFTWLILNEHLYRLIPWNRVIVLIVFTVALLVLSILRNLTSPYRGASFALMAGGRLKVGFIGFLIYTILKDLVTTFINVVIWVFLFALCNNPALFAGAGPIVLICIGLSIMLQSLFL